VRRVTPHVPARQRVLSLPIPLRLLLGAQPNLMTPVLQVMHRVITRQLLKQGGAKPDQASPPSFSCSGATSDHHGGLGGSCHRQLAFAGGLLHGRVVTLSQIGVAFGKLDQRVREFI